MFPSTSRSVGGCRHPLPRHRPDGRGELPPLTQLAVVRASTFAKVFGGFAQIPLGLPEQAEVRAPQNGRSLARPRSAGFCSGCRWAGLSGFLEISGTNSDRVIGMSRSLATLGKQAEQPLIQYQRQAAPHTKAQQAEGRRMRERRSNLVEHGHQKTEQP